MKKKSLEACIAGMEVAKRELKLKGWSVEEFSQEVYMSRQTASQFFNGHGVSTENFKTMCKKLGLQWEQVAGLEPFDAEPEDLGLPLRLKSRFYIQRDCVESRCSEVLKETRTFLRIKGNRKTGKTSLLIRVEEEARKRDYKPVRINLEVVLIDDFPTMNDFMRSFCAFIAEELGKEHPLDENWKEKFGNGATTKYFEEHLLKDLDAPLILILDNFDRVYEKLGSEKGDDFSRLIRAWHVRAMQSNERGKTWRQIRFVVAHSTEFYGLTANYTSPLVGLGKVVSLEDFSQKQGEDLAKQHGLNLPEDRVEELRDLVNGHPYLFQLALNYLKSHEVSLERLLEIASTGGEPFGNHLRQLLGELQKHLALETAFYRLITADASVELGVIEKFKLQGMGLVREQGDNLWIPRCKLYSQFFLKK